MTNREPAFARHLLRYGRDFCPELITRAEGSYLFTESGHRLLDFSSGQMCATIGHNHPAIVAAMAEAGRTVLHLDSTMIAPEVVDLADRLCAALPGPLDRAMFLNTGGEANEAALRLAKIVTGRHEVVALTGSWHGTTQGAASATYAHGRKGFGPQVPGTLPMPAPNCYRCPLRLDPADCGMVCHDLGWEMVDGASVGDIAALIVEPIQSAGGIIVPPAGYLKTLRAACDARDILLIFDESQTGLGRTGRFMGFDHDGVAPDILVLSKTLGGGLPLSAVVTSDALADAATDKGFTHYTSHVSDPLMARVGLAVLDVIEREGLTQRAAETGAYLTQGLETLARRFPHIGQVRGRGLLLGVELLDSPAKRTPGHGLIADLTQRAFSLGLNLNKVGGPHAVWRLAPPLNLTRSEAEDALAVLERCFTERFPETG